jgi:hypothetical protein
MLPAFLTLPSSLLLALLLPSSTTVYATANPLVFGGSPANFGYYEAHRLLFGRQSENLQTFGGNLGGTPPPISNSGNSERPFEVNGSTFVRILLQHLSTERVRLNYFVLTTYA